MKTRSKSAGDSPAPAQPPDSNKYFQALASRSWSDAERELADLKKDPPKDEWSKGYVKCLEGLMLTLRSNNDKHLYLPKILSEDSKPGLESIAREFRDFASFPLRADYDRGFFQALSDYLLIHHKFAPRQSPAQKSQGTPKSEGQVLADDVAGSTAEESDKQED